MIEPAADISTTVVIPAYGHCPHLQEILEAILSDKRVPTEVIVSHSGTGDPTEKLQSTFKSVTVLHSPERLFAGAARNRGAAVATSDILAFCDADTKPQPGWLSALVAAVEAAPRRVVVGAVGVAQTGGYWGLSNWLLEFSEQAPWRKGGPQTGGASCNMALRTREFCDIGGFPEGLPVGADTPLFASLREAGAAQVVTPCAVVAHFNNTGFVAFMQHQTGLGKGFADVRSAREMSGSFAVHHPILAPILFIPKAGLVLRRTFGGGLRPLMLGLYLLPGVLIGSAVWTWACFERARAHRSAGDQRTSG